MTTHYLEIVTPEVDSACALYESMHGVSFGVEDPSLGHARVAPRADGSMIGIRKPLAAHEGPTTRVYLAVADIHQAVRAAEAGGALVAYPPTAQEPHGTFAIVIQNDVQHGLWER